MFLFQKLITSHDPMTPIATTAIIPGLPKSLALKHVPWKSRRCWEGCKGRASIGKPSHPKNYCLPSCLKEATLVRQAWGHRDLSRGGKKVISVLIASEPPWKISSTSSWLNNYIQLREDWSHQCQRGLNLTARIFVPTICPPLWTSEQCSVLDSGFSEKVNKINRSNFDHFIRFIRSFPKAPGLTGNHPFRGAPRIHHVAHDPEVKTWLWWNNGMTKHVPFALRQLVWQKLVRHKDGL